MWGGRSVAQASSRALRGAVRPPVVRCTRRHRRRIARACGRARGLWRACCRASRGLRSSYACIVLFVKRCGTGADSVGECRNAGELDARARAGCIWEYDGALGGTMCGGTLENISDMRGKEGEMGESDQCILRRSMKFDAR